MQSKIVEALDFALKPVAIYFSDETPREYVQFQKGKRGCVGSMLIESAQGKTALFDRETYGCAGGGVGLCFGDVFTERDHPIESLLSTGDEALAALGKTHARSLGRGERFFASPELAGKWKAEFPYGRSSKEYVIFMPLGDASTEPDLVMLFANPDQLSALVIMAGYQRGTALNVIAPFSAACQSIAWAYQQLEEEQPKAIMGFFDISQRGGIPKDLLSLTMPYRMFKEMDDSADNGCLTTEVWQRIADR